MNNLSINSEHSMSDNFSPALIAALHAYVDAIYSIKEEFRFFVSMQLSKTSLIISSLKLNNIIVIVDYNRIQSTTWSTDTHPTLYPIDKKFASFGWEVAKCNGHDTQDIYNRIKSRSLKKPFALIAKTIKGYPISFMKNVPKWHYRSPNESEYLQAIMEINNL